MKHEMFKSTSKPHILKCSTYVLKTIRFRAPFAKKKNE